MTKKSKSWVAIFAIGSKQIGSGHIFRAYYLKQEFLKRGHQVRLFSNHSQFAEKVIERAFGKPIVFRPSTEMLERHWPIVVVDGLGSSSEWLKKLKLHADYLVSIDNVEASKNICDLNFFTLYEPRRKMINHKSHYGLQYLVMDPKLANAGIPLRKKLKNILLVQGGTDPKNILPKLTKALLPLLSKRSDLSLTIKVGTAPRFESPNFWKRLEPFKNISVIDKPVKNIRRIFGSADLAITSGGITMLELLALGVPVILATGINRELETMKKVSKFGAGIFIGSYSRAKDIKLLKTVHELESYSLRQQLSKRAKVLIDGGGASRTVDAIIAGQTTTYKAR